MPRPLAVSALLALVAALAVPAVTTPAAAAPESAVRSAVPTATTPTWSRDRMIPRGHSRQGVYLEGAAGAVVVSPSGVERSVPRADVNTGYAMCGDVVILSDSGLTRSPRRVSWRDLQTGRGVSATLPREANLVGPAPNGVVYAVHDPYVVPGGGSRMFVRTATGTTSLGVVPAFVPGTAAACDTSGVLVRAISSPSPRTGDPDRLVFVRFTGGVTTVTTQKTGFGTAPHALDVSGSTVLWALADDYRQTTQRVYRTVVGGATTLVRTVPSSDFLAGAGTTSGGTAVSVLAGSGGVTSVLVAADGTASPLRGPKGSTVTWWESAGQVSGAGEDGVWSGAGSIVWQPPYVIDVARIAGATRYETAAGQYGLRQDLATPAVVYVTSGESFADGLSGGPAAAARDGALLLTSPTALSAPTRDLITSARPSEVVVLGGPGAVSPSVEASLRALAPTVRRLSGADRYATSVAVSRDQVPDGAGGTVVVASGADFADALSGTPAAAVWHAPLLLTDPTRLRPDTAAEIERIGPSRVVVLGGTGAVSASVEAALRDRAPTVERIAGTNRWATSTAISAAAFTQGAPEARVVSGSTFADALATGALMARLGGPVLLSPGAALPAEARTELRRLRPATAYAIGGERVLLPAVVSAMESVAWR